ncbi:unnamed protein product [Clavelina lepadiformis]|uniref:Uncharacterized protein n=1 Tax=Clavelina lepadiformis TaxID=159417 RepID=A0ABP0FT57_CLALP
MDQVREIDISEFTGRDLLKLFEDEVDGDEWVKDKVFTFTGIPFPITITANPTYKQSGQTSQPGNGLLCIDNVASPWSKFNDILSDTAFKDKYKTFLENKLNSPLVNDFKKMELECCALLLFEIARRVENERGIDVKFLTRDEVVEAIDKALNRELGNLLTGIFRGSKTDRRSNYDVIMSKTNPCADMESLMENMTLNDTVRNIYIFCKALISQQRLNIF